MKLDVSILVLIILVVINGSSLSVRSQEISTAGQQQSSGVVEAARSDNSNLDKKSKKDLEDTLAQSLAINSETDKKLDNLSIVSDKQSSSHHHHHSASSSIHKEENSLLEESIQSDTSDFQLHHNKTMKYCANFAPIKELFENHIEPLYTPLVGLLPEDLQLVLLDQTPFLGLSNASCALISIVLLCFVTTWLSLIRFNQKSKSKQTCLLNETIVALNNQLKQAKYTSQTYNGVIQDLEQNLSDAKSRLEDREAAWGDLNDKYQTLVASDKQVNVDSSKLEELDRVRQEFDSLSQRYSKEIGQYEYQVETLTRDLTEIQVEFSKEKELSMTQQSELEQLRAKEAELVETIELLKSNMAIHESVRKSTPKVTLNNGYHDQDPLLAGDEENLTDEDIPSSFDNVMRLVDAQKRVKEIEESLSESNRLLEQKSMDYEELHRKLDERESLVESVRSKLTENEKAMRELELQIKVMNELREKDTKQHLRAMSEMDAQVKKKAADAEKVTHLLEQIRVKQERIQELESQFSRIERQANQERQTYEKQAHENWLTGRKLDKELKETKSELTSLKEQLNELSTENANLKQSLATAMAQQSQRMVQPPAIPPPINPALFFMSPQQQQHLLAAGNNRRSMNESQINTSTTQQNLDDTSNEITASQSDTSVNKHMSSELQVDTNAVPRPASRSGSQYSASAAVPTNTASSTLPSVPSYPFLRPNPYMFPPYAPGPPNPGAWAQFYSQQQLGQQSTQLTEPPQNLSSPNPDYTGQKRLSTSSSLFINPPTATRVRSSNSNSSQQPSPSGGAIPHSISLAHNPSLTPSSNAYAQSALNSTSNNLINQNNMLHASNTSFLNDSVNLSTIQNDSMLAPNNTSYNASFINPSGQQLQSQQEQQQQHYNQEYNQNYTDYSHQSSSTGYYNQQTSVENATTANDYSSQNQMYPVETTQEESNNNFNV